MKISELKALGEKASNGLWNFGYVCVSDPMEKWFANRWQIVGQDTVFGTEQAAIDAYFISTMRNHWGLLLQVADKAKIALAVSSTSKMLAIKEALEELEAVK